MKKIDHISLHNLLPVAFADGERRAISSRSQVWLNDETFLRDMVYMIVAESGSGKSSLCSYIYGNRNDYEGRVMFDDVDVASLDSDDWCNLRRNHIALLPQDLRLFPELTVIENIELKNSLTHHKSLSQIKDMLSLLEIDNKINQPVSLLSIGQQQRVAIVRTLCQPFDFLLLDEPVSHLDERANYLVAQLITSEASCQKAGVIATSVGNPLLIEARQIKL